MSYLLDKKIQRKKQLNIVFFVIVFLILFYFRSGIFNKFSYAINFIFHPIIFVGNKVFGSFGGISSFFSSKNSLVIENENLRMELKNAQMQMINYDSIVLENTNLKEIFSRKDEKVNMVLAAILSKPNRSPYDTLIIDAGKAENIEVGETVFALGNIPIGRVVEVDSSSSKVILFSNPLERMEVVLGNSSKGGESGKSVFLEVVGRGGGNFEMIVPDDFVVAVGDQIVLPGMKPYVVGVVEKIISDSRDAFQKLLIASPVNIQDLKFVEIEK